MRVYLDTSGWSAAHDVRGGVPLRDIGREFLFSSCNLDEMALAEFSRARALAQFAWLSSNKLKLKDHLELAAAEIRSLHGELDDSDLFENDVGFMRAWEQIRSSGVPAPIQDAVRRTLTRIKKQFREHLRDTRDLFRPLFDGLESRGFQRSWPELLNEMVSDGSIMRMVEGLLAAEGLLRAVPSAIDLRRVSLTRLPATASWTECYIALSYLATQNEGRVSRPDFGDQVDFRHACYAGVADVFVTGDVRFKEILDRYVVHKRAEIVTPDEFFAEA
jgi:hypothetical protein